MALNGDLYMGTCHAEQKAYQLHLLDDVSYKAVNDYELEMPDYKNNVIGLEPEITFIDPEKRSVFVGGLGRIILGALQCSFLFWNRLTKSSNRDII